jgi:hypothetical protein
MDTPCRDLSPTFFTWKFSEQQRRFTTMDLYTAIQSRLDEVNAVSINCGTTVCSLVKKDGYWEKVSGIMPAGFAEKGCNNHTLLKYLADTPHETKRKGTVLVVTGIDLTKNISVLGNTSVTVKPVSKIIEVD